MTRKSIIGVVVLSAMILVSCDNASESKTNSTVTEAAVKVDETVKIVTKAVSKESAVIETAEASFPSAALIDPNTASLEDLQAIPGIAEEVTQAIVAGRPFASPTALHAALQDIADEKALNNIYRYMFIKVGLNNGAEDDYKLIPTSLSPRKLAHEFEEYRPYESLAQFNKEMSKYMSAEEAMFLQRYVFID